ncbi:S-adenosyl-L-methionine-dependent tRNA 4-demethylwyosine synthase TYW1 [Nilaparvata lugens]|uniref:S-adenosyl-L-methionine-dependent tRNA 4-demethylwyosine synthase TYW1 n=1 Tax=Nilaparvata lugens TaxID=108931 RepID=UPI00193E6775|nr:S-adenosyl-L-methionine-dependent tRNA 4-demethylwyosine synthase TYW1 [Nilaparvata lugens]
MIIYFELLNSVAIPIIVGALSIFILSFFIRNQKLIDDWLTSKTNSVSSISVIKKNKIVSNSKVNENTTESPASQCNSLNCCSQPRDSTNFSGGAGKLNSVIVFFGTETGNTKALALKLAKFITQIPVQLIDLKDLDAEDKVLEQLNINTLCVFVLPTHFGGKPPKSAEIFFNWLHESSNDFRVEKTLLKGLKFAVFGLGNSQYADNYNVVGKQVDASLADLGADRLIELGLGDEDETASKNGGLDEDFDVWLSQLANVVENWPNNSTCTKTDNSLHSKCLTNAKADSSSSESGGEEELMDMEDIGVMMGKHKQKADEPHGKEMITPKLRQVLTKQGYRLIGTHSGVKMCRWTKSMLRGRGGCYKHTFYGIESHRCMEATPSLACANKCVFCWRHHSNPVGTEWRWKQDSAQDILDGALANHYNMINQFKGVPGVIQARFAEGLEAKHCALSLVGEPIMYPEINKFITLLHDKGISSFLVTNAQFPEAIRNLSPVTQLYVSVDASTKESLKKIDRPLFKDFWDRFIDSLKALSEKGQRTVYRLTLVKAWNFDELNNYAQLVELGNPDFIEIKGVTFCGDSNKVNSLTMQNVPWHEEVVSFAGKLVDLLPNYDIASEHEHSNCILIAHKKFQ